MEPSGSSPGGISRLHPSSPTTLTLSNNNHRKIAIAVDLSDESAHAVKWAVQNYLRPGDSVILLHVRPTAFLYGADWGSIKPQVLKTTKDDDEMLLSEEEFDKFTTDKTELLAQPLVEAEIPYKTHIVKDHDLKERLCLEVERLGLSAMIMGSRGFGAVGRMKTSTSARLGSVSDYCVRHCVCPVIVVRYPDDGPYDENEQATTKLMEVDLHPVPEEEDVNEQ